MPALTIPRSLVLSLALLLPACRDELPPDAPDVAVMRLTISSPSASTSIDVASPAACNTVTGGIRIPVNAEVTISALFLTPDGEPDEYANEAARYRLVGSGSADPAPSTPGVSFTRIDAFSGRLLGTSAGSGTTTFSLVHAETGAVIWGPCQVGTTAVVAETSPIAWNTLAGSPQSHGSHFQDASFISPQEGWVIGAPGDVYHTADGGTSWDKRFETAPTASTSFFRSVAFVSGTKGWIGDLNRFNNPEPLRSLWETLDGGRTWTNISSRITGAPLAGICGMWVIDATTVVGVGRWNGPAAFIRTQDAGATWQSLSLAPLLTGAVDVFFFNAQSGLIAGARGVGNSGAEQNASRAVILATSDGGATWSERHVVSRTGSWSWKISFPSTTVGYVAIQGPSSGALLLQTLDGGMTWREIEVTGAPATGLWGAGFSTPLSGWIGAEGEVWETRDGGLTWTKAPWALGQNINRFRMLSDGSAFAIGQKIHRASP